MKCLITKSVKTAAGQHDASRRPQTTQDGNHIALRCGTEIERRLGPGGPRQQTKQLEAGEYPKATQQPTALVPRTALTEAGSGPPGPPTQAPRESPRVAVWQGSQLRP